MTLQALKNRPCLSQPLLVTSQTVRAFCLLVSVPFCSAHAFLPQRTSLENVELREWHFLLFQDYLPLSSMSQSTVSQGMNRMVLVWWHWRMSTVFPNHGAASLVWSAIFSFNWAESIWKAWSFCPWQRPTCLAAGHAAMSPDGWRGSGQHNCVTSPLLGSTRSQVTVTIRFELKTHLGTGQTDVPAFIQPHIAVTSLNVVEIMRTAALWAGGTLWEGLRPWNVLGEQEVGSGVTFYPDPRLISCNNFR